MGGPVPQRIDKEKKKQIKEICDKQWDDEVELLDMLYNHEDVFTEPKEIWKEIKFRNAAIISQLNHIRMLATYSGGAVDLDSRRNTKEEKASTKEIAKSAQAGLEKKKKEWENRKDTFNEEKFGNK